MTLDVGLVVFKERVCEYRAGPGCFGIESLQKASSFVMLSSLTFNEEKLIVESIKRGSVYCLRITTAVTDKAYIQVA